MQREYFLSGATKPIAFRKEQLALLLRALEKHETAILSALHADMGKPKFEGYSSEVAVLKDEIHYALKHLSQWAKPTRVPTQWMYRPGASFVEHEPLGVVLIIGPWNYPFQLLLAPLVGAIAAGNCATLKPSELAPHTAEATKQLIADTFPPQYMRTELGGVETSQALLKSRWDHIFFTGGGTVGRVVMEAAAKHLTPVTLELGGKSPALIDEEVNIAVAARRVAWGKFYNAGQTCVAPDYVLVPKSIHAPFVAALKKSITAFFGASPVESPDYTRIINERHFDRLKSLAGEAAKDPTCFDRKTRYLAPTLLDGVSWDHPAMQEEIFGPVLPIVEYGNLDEAISAIQKRPKPLALYFFSTNRMHQSKVTSALSFGGGCIKDVLIHLTNPRLPFGGVGDSGMGEYHGKYGFDTFSHRKSVVKRPFAFDFRFRYPPYGAKWKLLRRLLP